MQDQSPNDRFLGRTYLYLRDHPLDNGSEPLPAMFPFWVSPDIAIIQPDGTRGLQAVAGQDNIVEVRVHNAGGIDADDAYVDLFFSDPTTAFTPATATFIGGTYLSVPGYANAGVSFMWTPPPGFTGHGCLLSRVSLIIPPDTYANPDVFDVPGDRHVTQRNITVRSVSQAGIRDQFSFNIANPTPQPMEAQVSVKEITSPQEQEILRACLGCGFAAFSPVPLAHRSIELSGGTQPGGENIAVVLEPFQTRRATLYLQQTPNTRRGDLSAVHIAQKDGQGRVVGGLVVMIRTPM